MKQLADDFTSVRRSLIASMDSLSDGEKKVARALLAQYPAAGLTTVAGLAQAAGVSAPTVVRFVARLGFSGYPAFQAALVHEVNEEMGSPLKQVVAKSQPSAEGTLRNTHGAFTAMLDATYGDLPESEFNTLVELLSETNREVRVIGGRFSRLLAEYLVLHLRLVRPKAHLVGQGVTDRSIALLDATPSSVLVAFDYRRYDSEVAVFAEAAAKRGVTVALMTDNWLSPIAQTAKVVLPCLVDSASPFDSLVPALALTESVIAGVTERLGKRGVDRLAAVEEQAH